MTEQIQLTEEAARKNETHCEVCGSTDFYAHSPASEGSEMWQRFTCNDCDTTWTEVFLLYLIEVELPAEEGGQCQSAVNPRLRCDQPDGHPPPHIATNSHEWETD